MSEEENVQVDQLLLEHVIEAIRPSLQADGGDLKLVGEKDGVVSVELTGNCAGCPLSTMTMSMGVERVLVENVPGVKRVEAVMADGGMAEPMDNPFYF
jgi:Fe-S cluster biogenesis protein NfuA